MLTSFFSMKVREVSLRFRAMAMQLGQQTRNRLAAAGVVQQPPAVLGQVVEVDVLGYGKLADQLVFLMDGLDAQLDGLRRVQGREASALQNDPAGVRAQRAGHDLDEGGFARPVLPDQGLDLPLAQVEIHRLRACTPG
jgi:hypothetical protein